MSLGQVNSGFNLLGQGAATAARMAPIRPPAPLLIEPKLDVRWGDFHQGFFSSVRAFFAGPFTARKFLAGDYFRDCWVERRIPKRAVLAAALWHLVFLIAPFSWLAAVVRHNAAFDNTQLTWSGPIEDFPTLEIAAAKPKTTPRGDRAKPLPAKGADAFHPRQRIVVDPVRPNHPRQTLINPVAPQLGPKLLPELPNIVQLQAAAAPSRPRIEISADALAKLHPRLRRVATVTSTPLPDVPNLEQKPAELSLTVSQNAPARPKLDLSAGAAPRVAERAQTGDSVAAPEIGAAQAATNGNPSTLIALSAAPAPPNPDAQPPQGNLAARISISPEGTKRGVPDGSPSGSAPADAAATASGSGGGKSPVGISISGGNPQPKNTVSGLAGSKLSLPSTRSLTARPESNSKTEGASERTAPPNFASLPPGAKPEQVFADKRVYTLAVNTANLNSASGSWIMNFSELTPNQDGPRTASSDLTGLALVRKVDPKYPPELIEQNVQGEVILYAVIRADGSVDSIQLVRGIDLQLDANAKSALSQWKFRPALKNGIPVDLEAIVHIPFKIRDDR
jgi:TonB family protein